MHFALSFTKLTACKYQKQAHEPWIGWDYMSEDLTMHQQLHAIAKVWGLLQELLQ